MITTPVACVVDSSVAIKLVITEPDSSQAHLLFDHLAHDPLARFYIPDLFRFECANILRTQVKGGHVTDSDAGLKLIELQGLRLSRWDSPSLIADALSLALAHDLTAYDASYVATSVQTRAPLITADAKLVRKLAGTNYNVVLLSALSIPPPPGPLPSGVGVTP